MGTHLTCCMRDPSESSDEDKQRRPPHIITSGSPSSPTWGITPTTPQSTEQLTTTPSPGLILAPPSSITTPAISEPVLIDQDPAKHVHKRNVSSPINTLFQIKEDEEMSQLHIADIGYQRTFSTSLSNNNKGIHHNQDSSCFHDADLNVAAPTDLFNYFSTDTSRQSSNHSKTQSTFSDLDAARFISKERTENWPLQRYITLRTKDKKSFILDFAKFGLFLTNQHINKEHVYYDSIWNKYDKLSEFKVDLNIAIEIISELLHEYLMTEYVLNIRQIISADLERALQLILPFIPSYRMLRKVTANTATTAATLASDTSSLCKFEYCTSREDEDEDLMQFTFNDFCNLGDSLLSVQDLEEDDVEDSFIIDYWDMVQYINSRKLHVWGQVINKSKCTGADGDCENQQLDTREIADLVERVLIDYGRNGLGHDNMEIYSSQIQEYSDHLTQLFGEWVQSELGENCTFITKKQFFEFVECIHPTKKAI